MNPNTSSNTLRRTPSISLCRLEENYGLISEKKVQSAIKIVANENRYHPVRDYLNNLQWDGTERIRYAPVSYTHLKQCFAFHRSDPKAAM